MTNERLHVNGNLCSIVVFALILRWSVSLHSYSGENSPPMFGDYEAQRHWMEITVNLPIREWYLNTSNNDLLYWGLDYPPLTAYHSYLNGKIAKYVNPGFVELFTSRGFESYDHKFFMRTTVILTDFLIFFTSVIIYFGALYKNNHQRTGAFHGEVPENNSGKTANSKIYHHKISYLSQVTLVLMYPGLILIDHGHFQYNSFSLGLTIAAVSALLEDRLVTSSVMFCLALNYKQMSLYHSLPFFVYILSHALPKKSKSWLASLKKLLSVSFSVLLVFGIIWFPFLKDKNIFLQVLKRLFPVNRGIFEDKVSNFWCALNIIIKLNTFHNFEMTKMCIICVCLTSFISLINLFKYPTFLRFLLSLINVSLSFFLFSYQVHEKSILLVSIPILLYFHADPFPCFWFSLLSIFSMLPLLLKDNLILPFISLTLLYILFVSANIAFPLFNKNVKMNVQKTKNYDYNYIVTFLLKISFLLSLIGCGILFLCITFVKPPIKYPDLWPLLISVYSFMHFFSFLIYFNYVQIFKMRNSE